MSDDLVEQEPGVYTFKSDDPTTVDGWMEWLANLCDDCGHGEPYRQGCEICLRHALESVEREAIANRKCPAHKEHLGQPVCPGCMFETVSEERDFALDWVLEVVPECITPRTPCPQIDSRKDWCQACDIRAKVEGMKTGGGGHGGW